MTRKKKLTRADPSPGRQDETPAKALPGSALGEVLKAHLRERLRSPQGQAEVKRLSEDIAASVMATFMAELDADIKRSGEEPSPLLKGLIKAHHRRRQ